MIIYLWRWRGRHDFSSYFRGCWWECLFLFLKSFMFQIHFTQCWRVQNKVRGSVNSFQKLINAPPLYFGLTSVPEVWLILITSARPPAFDDPSTPGTWKKKKLWSKVCRLQMYVIFNTTAWFDLFYYHWEILKLFYLLIWHVLLMLECRLCRE